MDRTTLKHFTVKEISATNKKVTSEKIELENKYNYNMRILSDTKCVGEFTVTVADKNDRDNFSISATCMAAFDYPQGKNATELHIETMSEIFLHAKSFILTLTANMGITPIYLPQIDMGNISIINVKIPPKQ